VFKEFNPSRLVMARKRRGLSKTALAAASKISVRSLGYYESGEVEPSEEHQELLASALELPVEFFFGPDIEEIAIDAASFRSLSTMTASQRDSALAAGSFAVNLLCKWIEERFELPQPSVPSLRGFDYPEAAARALRAEWRLGERPIKNVVHLLEAHGVRVFSLPVDSASVDAFSVWHRAVPYVFLNPKKSAERGRMDSAHELGHLCLHHHGMPRSREAELEADAFASAFLMPEGDVLAHAPRRSAMSVATIHRLKKRWGVAAIALVHRFKQLRILTEWQYRSFCIQLSQAGYRKREDEMPRDSSQVFAKVFDTLRSEGMTRSAIARDLALTSAEVDSLLVGLVIASVPSSQNERVPSQATPTKNKSHLRAV
jgi:Zn-dependent peptidase ImmA (M78 family)/DNA-binding XRE family transcriptional regulator